MARLFITRMLETLFRRWWLYAIPVVLMLALGVVTILGAATKYQSSGVLLISDQSQQERFGVGNQNDFGTDTAAAYTARQMNTVLGTDAFLDILVENSGLTKAVESGTITRDKIRKSVGAAAAGDNLVSVKATTSNSELSWRLADAAITSYKQWESGIVADDSQAAVDLLTERVASQQATVDSLTESAASSEALTTAVDELNRQQNNLDQAKAAVIQATATVDAQYNLVDPPEEPTSPTSSRKEDLQTLVLFLVLGGLISAAAVVVGTLLDRSVRYAEEIEMRLEVPVLATVPDSRAARAPLVV